ncbi:hypothetical protein X777_13288 [Ooceraea biroi]|uniref:Uncharacterized protein n=1 Tax=Ooceraea biroi TaxID=2015173 RepID=A0A026WVW7_OOCBI|nr:hypothetical protein X777_13288 [Ooceraea biroi]
MNGQRKKRRASRCLMMCGNGASPEGFQHGGPLKQHHALTSISWNLIYPPSLKASPLDPISRRLATSFGAHAIVPARNKSPLGGPLPGIPGFRPAFLRGRRRLRLHCMTPRRAGGTDADDGDAGCGEGAYPPPRATP